MKHITQTTHRWIGINGTALSKELKQPLNNGVGNRAGHIVHQFIEAKESCKVHYTSKYHRNPSEYASSQARSASCHQCRQGGINFSAQMWMSLSLDSLSEPPCSTCSSFNSSSRLGGYLLSELGFNSDRTCKLTYRCRTGKSCVHSNIAYGSCQSCTPTRSTEKHDTVCPSRMGAPFLDLVRKIFNLERSRNTG